MQNKSHEYNLNNVVFDYVIESVGLKNIGDFEQVVSEIKYYFVGSIGNPPSDGTSFKRLFLQQLDTSNLDKSTFISAEDLTKEQLKLWLEKSINFENLNNMKKLIYEMFNPPINFVGIGYFKDSNPIIDPPNHVRMGIPSAHESPV